MEDLVLPRVPVPLLESKLSVLAIKRQLALLSPAGFPEFVPGAALELVLVRYHGLVRGRPGLLVETSHDVDVDQLRTFIAPAILAEKSAFGGLLPGRLPYLAAKGLAALLLYPLVWLDPLLDHSSARDRIPGGYFVIAERR